MSLQVPTTEEIRDSIIASFDALLPAGVLKISKKFLFVLATVLAGIIVVNYKYTGFIFLQQFVQFASYQPTIINGKTVIPLVEWGRLVGVGDPDPATRWQGQIQITINSPTGSIPANTQLSSSDNNYTYITLSAVTLAGASVVVDVRAAGSPTGDGGRGVAGNLENGAVLTFVSNTANVNQDTIVTSTTTTAADAEDWEVYRGRVADRFAARPQGGASVDYEQWGEGVEGIINVYPYTGDPGEVDVYCEATTASSGDPDGIPTATQLQSVSDAIELDVAGLASRRPVNAYVNVYAITRTGFDVVISGFTTDDPSVQTKAETQVVSAVEQYFLSRAPYIAGLTAGRRQDRVTESAVAGVVQDVATAYSAVFGTIQTKLTGGSAINTYSLGEGEKAKAENVNFV